MNTPNENWGYVQCPNKECNYILTKEEAFSEDPADWPGRIPEDGGMLCPRCEKTDLVDFLWSPTRISWRATCDFIGYGYPHPGCAEFGPPDSWDCPNLYDRSYKILDEPHYDPLWEPYTVKYCEFHAEEFEYETEGEAEWVRL